MAIQFKTPEEIATQYLLHLKGLKPEVNTDQTDSDWWVRAHTVGGVLSGLYADQRRIADDVFPKYARHDALKRHLELYFSGDGADDFLPATPSIGEVGVTGTIGSSIGLNQEFVYEPNGNSYQSTEAISLTTAISGTLASGTVSVQSVASGQSQNLLAGAALKLPSPPVGVLANAVALVDFADGSDSETDEQAAARIEARVQYPPAGGNRKDYVKWAKAADPSVIDASVIRYIHGPGTVGVCFIAGTKDVDAALNFGDPVIRIPDATLVQKVQDYINALQPETDCSVVFAAQEINVDVTVRVRLTDGDLDTVPASQLTNRDGTKQVLTQRQLIQREVARAVYKTPPGGRRFGATGYVVAAEIESSIDDQLGDTDFSFGSICQIVRDRQVDDLAASGPDLVVADTQIFKPGTVTVVEMA